TPRRPWRFVLHFPEAPYRASGTPVALPSSTRPRIAYMPDFRQRIPLCASLLTLLVVSCLAPSAGAQELVLAGERGLGAGLEGGSVDGRTEWQRARTRLTAGSTFHVDEFPEEAWGFRAFVEFEPRVGVGAEGRYL